MRPVTSGAYLPTPPPFAVPAGFGASVAPRPGPVRPGRRAAYVLLPVRLLRDSLPFYTHVLGLMAEREMGRVATLKDRAGRVIILRETSGPDSPNPKDRRVAGSGPIPVFRLPGELRRHIKRLRTEKVLIRASSVPLLGEVAYLADHDGNRVWVHDPEGDEFGPPPTAPVLSCVLVNVAGDKGMERALRFYTEGLAAVLEKKGSWPLLALSNLKIVIARGGTKKRKIFTGARIGYEVKGRLDLEIDVLKSRGAHGGEPAAHVPNFIDPRVFWDSEGNPFELTQAM